MRSVNIGGFFVGWNNKESGYPLIWPSQPHTTMAVTHPSIYKLCLALRGKEGVFYGQMMNFSAPGFL